MARPTREESRGRTRARLLEAARQVFAARGYHDASVDEVAEAAGFSKGAVYSNFPGKQELFLALLRSEMEAEADALRALGEAAGSVDELAGLLQARYRAEAGHWCLLAAEFQIQAGRSPEVARPLAELRREQRRLLGGVIRRVAQGLGSVPSVDPEELAAALIGLAQGVALSRAADPAAAPPDLLGRSVALMLRAALGAAGPE